MTALKKKVEPGEYVYVFKRSGPLKRRVLTVGRVLCTIDGEFHAYRMDTGLMNTAYARAYTHNASYFLTEAEYEQRKQRTADNEALLDSGLNYRNSKLTREQEHTLAELLRSWGYGTDK